MTFIPDENKEAKLEENTPVKDVPEKTEKAVTNKKKEGSPLNSIIFLIVIGIALFYAKDFLTGEKDIPGLSEISIKTEAEEENQLSSSLKTPKIRDNDLRKLLEDFKTGYEKLHPAELLLQTQPEVKIIRFSEDKKSLLIELETITPNSTETQSQDIIYQKDEFGRLVTTGALSKIKLHPEEK